MVNVKAVLIKLKAEQAKLAKSRDALRAMLSEVEQVCEDTDEALLSLNDAIDILSRLQ
jgi:hypothetical protein